MLNILNKVFVIKKRIFTFAATLRFIARSSNGRTTVFGAVYVGSNPARATY